MQLKAVGLWKRESSLLCFESDFFSLLTRLDLMLIKCIVQVFFSDESEKRLRLLIFEAPYFPRTQPTWFALFFLRLVHRETLDGWVPQTFWALFFF